MAGNVAYGQTDVMNDRNYLYALMQRNPRDPLRAMAEQRLNDLNHRDILQQQAIEFGFRQKAADESVQSRKDALSEAEKGRSERAQVRAEIADQARHDRKIQGLVAAMNTLSYDQTPEGKAALANVRSEYMKEMGITGAPTSGAMTAKTTGEYGPGGATVKANTGASYDGGAFVPPNTTQNYRNVVNGVGAGPTEASAATPAIDPGPALPANWLQSAVKTVNADGTITTHLPSGGTATAYDRSTPKGLEAINMARQESSRLQGIPFVPVEATKPAYAANVPTNENVVPNPVPYNIPNVVHPAVANSVPAGFVVPPGQPNPSAAATPAPGAPQPSVFGNVNFNTGAAPAPTPFRPSPVPTPSPILTEEQKRLLAQSRQDAGY